MVLPRHRRATVARGRSFEIGEAAERHAVAHQGALQLAADEIGERYAFEHGGPLFLVEEGPRSSDPIGKRPAAEAAVTL